MFRYEGSLEESRVVPGAGLEPATFGCLRHHKGLCTSYDRLGGCPMSPTRYQLRHPGLPLREPFPL